jgi:cell division protein FtsB
MPERTPTRQRRQRGERFTPANTGDRLYLENVDLVRRIAQLRNALEVLAHENAQLRRTLSRLEAENRRLTPGCAVIMTKNERVARVRSMLRDPCSRNP